MIKSFYSLFTCLLLLATCYSKAAEDSTAVFFATNSHHLDEDQMSLLLSFVNELDTDSDFSVIVRGYTDHRGTEEFNRALSKRRADSVRQLLESQGLFASEIRIEPLGESAAELFGSNADQLKNDRRVEVLLIALKFKSLDDLHNALKHGNQSKFVIDPTKEQTLSTMRGTKVLLKPNSFCNAKGEMVMGDVALQITEALDPIEFLAENLSTVSSGLPLISGGMIKVEAMSESGEQLQLQRSSPMTVLMPSDQPDERMQLFSSATGEDWTLESNITPFAYKDLPKRPEFSFIKFKGPIYKPDLATKPVKPSDPVLPKELNAPDPDSFKPKKHWYDFLFKKSIQRKSDARFAMSMDRYMKQARKTDERVEKYKADCKTISQRKLDYARNIERWQAQELNRRNAWVQNVYNPAYSKHQMELSAAVNKFDAEYEAWKEKVNDIKEVQLSEAQTNGQMDISGLGGYAFSVSNLSWINADYFMETEDVITRQFEIKSTDPVNEKVVLVFKGMKSMVSLRLDQDDNYYKSIDIPLNQKPVILAYRIEEGRIMLCVKELDGSQLKHDLVYKESSLRELRQTIEEIVS